MESALKQITGLLDELTDEFITIDGVPPDQFFEIKNKVGFIMDLVRIMEYTQKRVDLGDNPDDRFEVEMDDTVPALVKGKMTKRHITKIYKCRLTMDFISNRLLIENWRQT